MESGRLRHRVTIQQSARAGDAMGQAVETWTTYATVWADIQPIRGREFFEAQKTASEITARVIIRYKSGINPAWRVLYGTKVYRIVEIINPGMRNKELQLMVTEQPQTTT